jgi:hypothetical protein
MKSKEMLPLLAGDQISQLELRLLMKSILHEHADIKIKCLLEGGTWTDQFLTVTEKGLVLNNDSNNKIQSIEYLDDVVQFVIDKPFDSYNPNLAYTVS